LFAIFYFFTIRMDCLPIAKCILLFMPVTRSAKHWNFQNFYCLNVNSENTELKYKFWQVEWMFLLEHEKTIMKYYKDREYAICHVLYTIRKALRAFAELDNDLKNIYKLIVKFLNLNQSLVLFLLRSGLPFQNSSHNEFSKLFFCINWHILFKKLSN